MSRGRRAGALVAAALVALVALLAGCTAGPTGAGAGAGAATQDVTGADTTLQPCPAQPPAAAAGAQLLPDLTFECIGGGSLDLGRARGVPTVLNLWGSWCGPCREELPVVQQLADAGGEQLSVIGVVSKDSLTAADAFAADAGVTFPSALDMQGDLMAGQGLNVLPVSYFLDADGGLAYTQIGPVADLEQFRQLVAEHLGVTL